MTRFILVLVALLPTTAYAQQTLTLDQALAIAEKQNLTLEAARTQIHRAEAGVTTARAALFPVVGAQGKYTHNYKEFSFATPEAGSIVIQEQEQFDLVANATVPLIVPSVYAGVSAANRMLDSSKAEVEVSRATVLLAVAQAFYAAAITDELFEARKHAVEVAAATAKNARERLKVGAVTQVETSRAELALVKAEQMQVEAEAARNTAYRALATALQVKKPFKVVVPENAKFDVKIPKPNVDEARLRRPEIRALEMSVSAYSAQANAAGFKWLPSLSAFGNAHWFNYANFAGDSSAWAVGLQLDWTLYDGGARDGQRRESAAREQEAAARLRLLNETIEDEIDVTHGNVYVKARGLDAATRGVTLAQQALKLVRAQYDAGAATQLDLLESQDALVTSEVALAQARFDFFFAELTYQRAIGRFPK